MWRGEQELHQDLAQAGQEVTDWNLGQVHLGLKGQRDDRGVSRSMFGRLEVCPPCSNLTASFPRSAFSPVLWTPILCPFLTGYSMSCALMIYSLVLLEHIL